MVDNSNDLSHLCGNSRQLNPRTLAPLIVSASLDGKLAGQNIPSLTIVWQKQQASHEESPEQVWDRMQWRGPMAIVSGTELDAVAEEAIFALRAAWPELEDTRKD